MSDTSESEQAALQAYYRHAHDATGPDGDLARLYEAWWGGIQLFGRGGLEVMLKADGSLWYQHYHIGCSLEAEAWRAASAEEAGQLLELVLAENVRLRAFIAAQIGRHRVSRRRASGDSRS